MASQTVNVRPGAQILAPGLRQLSRQIRMADREAYRGFRISMKESAAATVVEAKALARRHSRTIPRTIRGGANMSMIYVQAGNRNTPIARLYEVGNVKRGMRSASAPESLMFKHPVFQREGRGSAPWVEQPMYPYLKPAVATTFYVVERRFKEALVRAFESNGLRVS